MGDDRLQTETLVTRTLCELFVYRTSCYLFVLWHSSNSFWARGEGFYPRTLYGFHSYSFWKRGRLSPPCLHSSIHVSNHRDCLVILTQSSFVKCHLPGQMRKEQQMRFGLRLRGSPCYRTHLWREAGVGLHRSNSSQGRLGLNLPRPVLSWWSMDFL